MFSLVGRWAQTERSVTVNDEENRGSSSGWVRTPSTSMMESKGRSHRVKDEIKFVNVFWLACEPVVVGLKAL